MKEDLIFELSGPFEDELAFTVVPREIYRAYRNKYNIFIITSRRLLWRGNKYVRDIIPSHPKAIKIPSTAEHLSDNPKHSRHHILQLQLDIVRDLLGLTDLTLTELRPHLRLDITHIISSPDLSAQLKRTPYWVVHTDQPTENSCEAWDPQRWANVTKHLHNGRYKLNFLHLSSNHDEAYTPIKDVSDLRELHLEVTLWLIQHAHGIITTNYVFPHLAAALGRPCIVITGSTRPASTCGYTSEVIKAWDNSTGVDHPELLDVLVPQDFITGKPCTDSDGACGCNNLVRGKTCKNVIPPDTFKGPSVSIASCINDITDKEITGVVMGYEKVMEEIGYDRVDAAIQEAFKKVQKGD